MAVTVGVNSYIDADGAGTYFADRLYIDEWTGASAGDKDKALLMARRTLDQKIYIGHRADPDQLLAWPRRNIPCVDSSVVPQSIIDAQCELALAFLREDLTADDGTRGMKRLQAGSVAIEYDGRAPEKRLPDAVLALIRVFLAEPTTANSIAMVV
jgi:hypothetical protein